MKQFILIFVFTMLTQVLFGQTKWGIYGGLTSASVNSKTDIGGDNTYDIGGVGAPHFGFFIEPNLTRNLYFETGMMIDKRGFSKREYYEPYDIDVTYDYTMPYVGVPMVLNLYIVNRGFKLYASAGQKIGFTFEGEKSVGKNFSASSNGTSYDFSDFETLEIPVGKDGIFKSFNYDLIVGIGIGVSRFYIAYNYNIGLRNISNIDILDYRSQVQNICLKIDFSKRN